ncbi:MAG TPA: TRAM domain-containing protein, partial [Symbiobacteriaceae bacterium]|nr:TRAM domain-containing protein [Symbiobacteriaceae bacterium]
KELSAEVRINEDDVGEGLEVDSKLLKLTKLLGGKVVTNDYNLNKVAELQGVPVLNINELANAVKPAVLPGEEMTITVIKDGKEVGQGVAYLDDGTMIVVDGGKRYIGDTIGVVVTSVLQTAAGRMIFAKPKLQAERVAP